MKKQIKSITVIILAVLLIFPQTVLLLNAAQTTNLSTTQSYLNDIPQGNNKVILPPTILSYIDSVEDYNKISERKPATAIFHINNKGEIVTKNGVFITTLNDAKTKLNNKTNPAYYIESEQSVSVICDYYVKTKPADAFVISDDSSILKAVKAQNKYLLCVLDASEREIKDQNDLFALREEANKSDARVVILPLSASTIENVEYLHKLLTTVWTLCRGNTDLSLLTASTAGVSGIVGYSDISLKIEEVFNKYFAQNSMLRMPNFVGHRGLPSLSQENTLAGSIMAVQQGATVIENDVYLTSDGVAVVMHDSTIDRTTNGTGYIANMTYEQLSKFMVDVNKNSPMQPIPKLSDYFDEFCDKDVVLYIEIKQNNVQVVPEIVRLIKLYEISDQVNLITFNKNQMLQLKSLMPEMSMGYLTSSLSLSQTDYLKSFETVLSEVINYQATFNPSFQKGALGVNLITAALQRGVTVWPWTMNDQTTLDKYFMMGTYGITTNYTQLISNYSKYINVSNEYVFTPSENYDAKINVSTYSGAVSEDADIEMILIDGNPTVKYEYGIISATESGKATVMFSHTAKTKSGNTYYIYSQPVVLNVLNDSDETTDNDELTDTDITAVQQETEPQKVYTCKKSSAFLISMFTSLSVLVFIFKRRK